MFENLIIIKKTTTTEFNKMYSHFKSSPTLQLVQLKDISLQNTLFFVVVVDILFTIYPVIEVRPHCATDHR